MAVDPAIIGGCIGVTGTLAGTALTLAIVGRRDARATALATAAAVVAIEQYIWSPATTDGAKLLGALKDVDIRLRKGGVAAKLRSAFGSASYACWLDSVRTIQQDAAPQISQDRLTLRSSLEAVILHEILKDGLWLHRRRERKRVMADLATQTLPAIPGSPLRAP